jgi:hypothetical protein
LKLTKEKGKLVPLEEIKRDWGRIAQAVKTGLVRNPIPTRGDHCDSGQRKRDPEDDKAGSEQGFG